MNASSPIPRVISNIQTSPPLKYQVDVRQRTTEQGRPSSIHLKNVVEDRRLDELPVPGRTGGLVQMTRRRVMRGALKELQSLLRILRFNSKCRSSDAKDSGMMFRRMLPAFSPTICGIFRECLIFYLPRYEREV